MGGPPKWMVKIMENPIKIDDLGVPVFLETPIYIYILYIYISIYLQGGPLPVISGVIHNPYKLHYIIG